MKTKLFFIIIFWAQIVCAQNKPKIKLEHQLEYGINYYNFLNINTNINGLGLFYLNGYNWTSNYYFGYKTIINKKHNFKFNNMYFESLVMGAPNSNSGLTGISNITLNVGYAYQLPLKKIAFSLGANLSYRYDGSETVVYAFTQNPNFKEGVRASIYYNSVGFSPNAEIEYFITKNFGIGVNLNLNYYPFENAKLKGDGTNEPDPLYVEMYKPNNLNFNATFKLAYKFSFTKTK
jgi:hypothetical protein